MNSRGAGATLPQLRAPEKWCIHPKFDSAAGLGRIPLTPGQIPYLILRVTGDLIPLRDQSREMDNTITTAGGPAIGGERAYVGLGSRGTREPQD